jgi:H+/gluconate symporter-like permease
MIIYCNLLSLIKMLTYDTMIPNPRVFDEPYNPKYKCYILICVVPILLILLGVTITINYFAYKNDYDDMLFNISSYNITHNYKISNGYNMLAVLGLLSAAFLITCLIILCLIFDKWYDFIKYYCCSCKNKIGDINIQSVV